MRQRPTLFPRDPREWPSAAGTARIARGWARRSHVADWPIRTDELVELYNRAQLGKLGDFRDLGVLREVHGGGRGGRGQYQRPHPQARQQNGVESDIHSLGVIADTDRGHIALSISVANIPDGKSDEAYNDMVNLARSLTNNVWAEAPQ